MIKSVRRNTTVTAAVFAAFLLVGPTTGHAFAEGDGLAGQHQVAAGPGGSVVVTTQDDDWPWENSRGDDWPWEKRIW
jgi:hypothetical protein